MLSVHKMTNGSTQSSGKAINPVTILTQPTEDTNTQRIEVQEEKVNGKGDPISLVSVARLNHFQYSQYPELGSATVHLHLLVV